MYYLFASIINIITMRFLVSIPSQSSTKYFILILSRVAYASQVTVLHGSQSQLTLVLPHNPISFVVVIRAYAPATTFTSLD